MAQHATDNIEMMPDSPVAREDLGAGGTSRGAGARSPLFWKVLLLSVAVVWGYSFTTMKDALDTIPVFELLYVRFLPAALVMFFIFHKRIIAHLNARNLIVGLGMGALMWARRCCALRALAWWRSIALNSTSVMSLRWRVRSFSPSRWR